MQPRSAFRTALRNKRRPAAGLWAVFALFALSCTPISGPNQGESKPAAQRKEDAGPATDAAVAVDVDESKKSRDAAVASGKSEPNAGKPTTCDANQDSACAADPCAADNGGCDALTECTAAASGSVCGDCPDGYEGNGKEGCVPRLLDLTVVGGELNSQFLPERHDYELAISAFTARVIVTASVPTGSHVEINDARVESGQGASTLLVPPEVKNIVVAAVSSSGSRTRYDLKVTRRDRNDVYIKADRPGADDEYGCGVALYADTLVVGALKEDSAAEERDESATDSGAVYVYRRRNGVFEREAFLKAQTPTRNDYFGASVAIWEDTIAVGAPRANPLGTTGTSVSGVVDVFVREGAVWSHQTRLESPAQDGSDLFGYSIALHKNRLVVGAPFDRATGSKAGAVYVFDRNGKEWGRASKLTAMAPRANDALGWAVAVDGDTVLAGAIERDTMSTSTGAAGAAHVFVHGPGGFAATQRLQAPTPMDGGSFGWSVAVRGDTAVIGAPRVDLVQTTPAGEAYVFERSAGMFSFASKLQADIPRRADFYGSAVALWGDLLAVGASGDASGDRGPAADSTRNDVNGAGAVYVYARSERSWLPAGYLKAPASDVRDYMGDHVALYEGVIASSSQEESSSSAGFGGDPSNNDLAGSGAAYVYY